ncbi:MAG: amidohydrolase [Alphaproteobacteria bacterium]|nr:amidohydrolase [Alphaproteobacteria bacterium]
MASSRFIVSADSHIIEPYDLWTKALGKKHGDKVPHRVKEARSLDGTKVVKGDFMFTGHDYLGVEDLRQENAGDTLDSTVPIPTGDLPRELAEKVLKSNSDPSVRLELQDHDGVSAEIIQGTNTLLAMRTRDTATLHDVAAVFNDYCAEYCSHDPKRLVGTAMVPTRDPDWAVKELKRMAKRNMKAAIINTDLPSGFEPYRRKMYDKIWAAAVDLDMVIVLHLGTGETVDPFALVTPEEQEDGPKLFLDIFDDHKRTLVNEFIFGGIFDRHRKLQLMLGEYECSWFPYFQFRLRQMRGALGLAMRLPPATREADQYIQDHVWIGFTDDQYVNKAWDVACGADKLMWGSDYPHPRNTFPNSRAILDRICSGMPAAVKANVEGINCARLFGLDYPKQLRAAAE